MTEEDPTGLEGAVCPVPLSHSDVIVLGHGSGGKLSHDLISRHFYPAFNNSILREGNDAAKVSLDNINPTSASGVQIAISTDAHVVWPLFFPGGDIGRLAVCGTVNDVAMLGARPLFLTAGFILEEGFSIGLLDQVIASMQQAAEEAKVQIVAGDTKVVQKGKADGLYISTAGFGLIPPGIQIHGANAQPGDQVIISGSIGDHGMAVLEARGEFDFEAGLKSDVAPLNRAVQTLVESGCRIHVLRDPTRGGLATSLNEIAAQSNVNILIRETAIPIKPAVSAVCEMLGFDPLYVANEGKMIVIVHPGDVEKTLNILREDSYCSEAAVIGEVLPGPESRVLMKTMLGTTRIVDVMSGELLPRIC